MEHLKLVDLLNMYKSAMGDFTRAAYCDRLADTRQKQGAASKIMTRIEAEFESRDIAASQSVEGATP